MLLFSSGLFRECFGTASVITEEVPNMSKSIPEATKAIFGCNIGPLVQFCCLLMLRVQIGVSVQVL
jgi:hypothetical protein